MTQHTDSEEALRDSTAMQGILHIIVFYNKINIIINTIYINYIAIQNIYIHLIALRSATYGVICPLQRDHNSSKSTI